MRRFLATCALSAILMPGAVVLNAQPVSGDVVSVGFPASVPSRHVIRYGQWHPILINLTAQGASSYDVELRCERLDLDGDRVSYSQPHVAVTPEAGPKRVWCYAVTLKESAGDPLTIDVIGADGLRISSIAAPMFEAISNDTMLILDVSTKRFTLLDRIAGPSDTYLDFAWGRRDYYRSICTANMPARDLPDRWIGLEAVDVLVWDDPDPAELSIPQLDALVRWVRNGGQLVVGVGPAGPRIQKSALAEIMPFKFTKPTREASRLVNFQRQFAAQGTDSRATMPIAVGDPASDALVTFRDMLPDNQAFELFALRHVGAGRVTASAVRLSDLSGLNPDGPRFLRELIDVNRNEEAFKTAEANEVNLFAIKWGLYDNLVSKIEFRRRASALVLMAFAFVAAYILLATFGAWNWLKRHGLASASWATFAGFAVVASALSIGAVGLSRGVTGAVHDYSFVDMRADSSEARASTYFGYKSNRRQRVNITLPGDQDWLRPLATDAYQTELYATPERYDAVSTSAELIGTPMRATLKQFQGFWSGAVAGSIRGSLTADRATGKFSVDSWLQNDLDVNFYGGYLLYIDPRLRAHDGGPPYRVAGLNSRNDRPDRENKVFGSAAVPPALNVLALKLPAMAPGVRLEQLGLAPEYGPYEDAYSRWASQEKPDEKTEPWLPTLRSRQITEWVDSFGVVGGALSRTDAAALLASTRNLNLHNTRMNDFDSVGRPLETAGLSDHDVTHWLTRGQAVLLLLSDQPGPAVLHLDGEPTPAKEGGSIYRIRIPIDYAGRPPRGTPE